MELMKYINSHEDWRTSLAASPYHLTIAQDGEYFILKYNMIESNFEYKIVQEARGCIVRYDATINQWICVCHPFDKFFNYGEKYSAVGELDWDTVVVQQKIDGSLIKIWYDKNNWHISTNGTIDAFKAECGDTTFGDLVIKATSTIPNFWTTLDPNYTYMFELTSPFNHIVIKYVGTTIWFLGRRNNLSDKEDNELPEMMNLRRPAIFPYNSLAECIAAAHAMGDDEEGYVVVDTNYKRIKIKGDEYLRLHHMRGNGPLNVLRVVEMWQTGSLDDFIAYYEEYKEFVDEVLDNLKKSIEFFDMTYTTISNYSNIIERRNFAKYANLYLNPLRAYLFARLDNKVNNAHEFFLKMRARTLTSYLLINMKRINVGVIEDE